jgi:predicted DsbA family dithiol-disulfide isomerase
MTDDVIQTGKKLVIDVWADVLCPWCYIGEHRLSKAIESSSHSERIELNVHTFQIDPQAPKEVTPTMDFLARKVGMTVEQVRPNEEMIARQARQDGLVYHVDRPMKNSFDMLRLVQLGNQFGLGWEYMRAMQAEVFRWESAGLRGRYIATNRCGCGITEDRISAVISGGEFGRAVREDRRLALDMGVTGVPFTLLNKRFGIPGAVGVTQYSDAIERAWKDPSDE